MDKDKASNIGAITPGEKDTSAPATEASTGPVEPTIGLPSSKKTSRLQKRAKPQRKERLSPRKGIKASAKPTEQTETQSGPSIEAIAKQVERLHATPVADEPDTTTASQDEVSEPDHEATPAITADDTQNDQTPDLEITPTTSDIETDEPDHKVTPEMTPAITPAIIPDAVDTEMAEQEEGLMVLAAIEEQQQAEEAPTTAIDTDKTADATIAEDITETPDTDADETANAAIAATAATATADEKPTTGTTRPLKQSIITTTRSSVFLTWAEYIAWGLLFAAVLLCGLFTTNMVPALGLDGFVTWSKPYQLLTVAGAIAAFYVGWMHMFGRIWDALLARISFGGRVDDELVTHAIITRDSVTVDALRDLPRYRLGEPLMALLELLVLVAIAGACWFYRVPLMESNLWHWLVALPEAAYVGLGIGAFMTWHLFIWGDLLAPLIDALLFRRCEKQRYYQ